MKSPVFILVHKPETDEEHFKKTFRKKAVKILSIIQLVSAVVAVVSHVRAQWVANPTKHCFSSFYLFLM